MNRHRVEYGRYAQRHLDELWNYVADVNSAQAADRLVLQIIEYCDALSDFPHRGHVREDIGPGIRVYGYQRRAAVAFTVTEAVVEILGIYWGGRDYEPPLHAQLTEDDQHLSPSDQARY